MKKTLIVIGSSSFSGSWFVKKMIEKNFKVIGLSRSKIKKEYNFINSKKFIFYKIDLNKNFNKMIKIIEKNKPSIVVNFAAQSFVRTSWNAPEDWFKTNTLSSIKLAHYLKSKKFLKKFIQISTPEIYGNISNFNNNSNYNPTTPYALSKLSFDLYLKMLIKKYKFPAIFIRSANVYGEGQQLYRIIPKAIIKIKKKEKSTSLSGLKLTPAISPKRSISCACLI
jgi:dTDP-glucose 4,6-dehydratase